jgi:hypothetical protein
VNPLVKEYDKIYIRSLYSIALPPFSEKAI